jgi:osmotically-inducible protein OsmY
MKKTMYLLALVATVVSFFLIKISLFASGTDESIQSSAKQTYVFKTYLKSDDIKIQSKDGHVTLTGTVFDESYKELAKETVANLPGVKRVDNKLHVLPEAPAMYSDAWLITKVKTTLLFHRNVNATQTDVFVKDGVITLRGAATSETQKNLTTEFVQDVVGVKSVKNEMTVLTATMQSDEKNMVEKMAFKSKSIDDASITALVKTTLLYHRSTSALNTHVETKGGVVNLRGKVSGVAEKDQTTKLVSDVHGVNGVVNNMVVEKTRLKTI